MLDEDGLNVWFRQQLVGYLWRTNAGVMQFRYAEEWLLENGFPISRALPLQSDAFADEQAIAHRFFANLLPEGGARAHLVRDLKIPDTDFDMLRVIGGECAGALTLMPAQLIPTDEARYQELSAADMLQLVQRRGHIYANQSLAERPRLSLAGAQDKCAVLFKDEAYFNPVGDAPSTHILKFESADYRNLPLYEVFTSRLAAAIGLPVVNIELCTLEKHQFAQISRYDRYRDDDSQVARIHQEDFCQALGYSHVHKYQNDGGPCFADCVALVRDASDDPAIDVQSLLRWQIFNVLAGNSDGHAKNLSLIYHRDGSIRLAPFYDLVCTRAIERIDANLAFDVGGERNPAKVVDAHWQALAAECDIGARFMRDTVDDVASKLMKCRTTVVEAFNNEASEYSAVQRVIKVVEKQCKNAMV